MTIIKKLYLLRGRDFITSEINLPVCISSALHSCKSLKLSRSSVSIPEVISFLLFTILMVTGLNCSAVLAKESSENLKKPGNQLCIVDKNQQTLCVDDPKSQPLQTKESTLAALPNNQQSTATTKPETTTAEKKTAQDLKPISSQVCILDQDQQTLCIDDEQKQEPSTEKQSLPNSRNPLTVQNVTARTEAKPATSQENRIALVIGNKDYKDFPLTNPINDARAIKSTLEKVGFNVIYRENATREHIDQAVHEFIGKLHPESIGLFYYSGHGAQADGSNYLIPVKEQINNNSEMKSRAYDAGIILDQMEEAGNRVNIIILDACRNNPFRGFRSANGGLATMNGPKGSYIAYSTSPGSVAADGSGEYGTYTKYLIRYLKQPGFKIEDTFKQVRKAVSEETNSAQIPWENSSLMGDFCFAGCDVTSAQELVSQSEQSKSTEDMLNEVLFWERIKNSTQTNEIKEYLEKYPNGKFADLANKQLKQAQDKLQRNSILSTNTNARLPEIAMVTIPSLKISIGKYEITQAQWQAITGKNPSKFSSCGDSCPVEMVSWDDVQSFIAQLNHLSGKNYRLPSEEEWYTICQAGGGVLGDYKYCGSNEIEAVAWYEDNSGNRTHPVGQKSPNAWGVYDMSGNVWEWTQGCYNNDCSLHVYRGGSWGVNFAADVKSAYRPWNTPSNRLSSSLGFRVVLN